MNFKALAASLLLLATSLTSTAYSIWPVPRSLSTGSDELPLSQQFTIVADESVDRLTVDRAKEVLDRAGIQYLESPQANPDGHNLLIGVNGASGLAMDYATTHNVPLTVFDIEEYCFDPHVVYVDNANILVVGNDQGSAYYAMASLEQMLEQSSNGLMQSVTIQDYAHAKYRGLVEGFYGHPWSMASRLNLLDYMKRYKMNYYVYGPKADPYHAGNWRLEYPETITDDQRHLGQITASDMKELAAHAAQCKVDFVWAIHPTLGSYSINLSWVDDIMTKFEQLHSLGVRHFGVSVDDMSGHPYNQSQLPHLVQEAIDAKWNTDTSLPSDNVGNVLFVPTCYALNYHATSSLTPIKEISPKVEVAFTGYDCFSNVRASSFAQMADYIGRDPIFWWNNPVNDDHDTWLYMHGLTKRWIIEQQEPVSHMRGFLLNPMNQGQASKVCIFSAADYAWNPEAFAEQASWEQSLRSIVKTEENVAALKDFIRVMSAYTTTEVSKPEGEEFKSLYQSFQTNYSETSIPDASELKDVMERCMAACTVLRTFRSHEDEDIALFYTDIEPWLNKVEDMATIVVRTLEFMNGESSLDHWTEFSDILASATNIHANHVMSVLEGSGTSTHEQFKEVDPTPTYLDPFIDFLASKLPNYTPRLPERDNSPKVITNLKTLSGVTLQTNNGTTSINGLNGITLALGEYVGVCLNRIAAVSVNSPALPDGVVLEHSISGKEWQQWNGDETDMAYLRVRGDSEEEVTLTFDRLTFTVPVSEPITETPTATTNMGTWQTYAVSNVVDGDNDTYFWSDAAQAEGNYVMLDFGSVNPRQDVKLLFNNSDQPSGTALIQLSTDAENWNTVATFSASDIKNNTYSCSTNNTPARYVRLYIESVSGGDWFQLAEFSVTTLPDDIKAVAHDANGNPITEFNDISLSTHYAATGEGWVEHRFIENLDIEEIHIYHNSHFTEANTLPVIELFSNGEWVKADVLDTERTIVKVDESMRHVTKLRISWTEGNAPDIYEIYPVGPEYVQPASEYTGIMNAADNAATQQVKFSVANHILTLESTLPMTHIELADAAGRVLASINPSSTRASLPCGYKMVIATVHLANGATVVRKLTL